VKFINTHFFIVTGEGMYVLRGCFHFILVVENHVKPLSKTFFMWRCGPTRAMASSFTRFFEITHRDTPQSVGLLWTSDQSVAETST
jgi:ABC-type xylose transport system permease subunit